MPLGDPAGYLPNVKKSRKKRGQPVYQPKPALMEAAAVVAGQYKTRKKRKAE